MVDIAQLVSASDCGSEGRGFESHYPPHKKDIRKDVFFYGVNGIRRERPDRREGKKVSGGHFFSSGENPCVQDGSRYGCWPARIIYESSNFLKAKMQTNPIIHP